MSSPSPNNAMHTDSAITLGFQSAITGAEPVMANRSTTTDGHPGDATRRRFGFKALLVVALLSMACGLVWLLASSPRPVPVSISFVGITTNTSDTYTTTEGTFPVTEATFLISNKGSAKMVQLGVYGCEVKDDPKSVGSCVYIGEPELFGVLAPGQSRTVSLTTPWTVRAPWRAVFRFSKYSWRHRFRELQPWKQEMVREFVSDKWLLAIPSVEVASGWIGLEAAK
jgi:hypothetical protein